MKTKILLLCLVGSAFLSNVSAQAVAQDVPREASSYAERLPPKIQKIQEQLPAWIQQPGNQEKAAAFMQKLKEHLDAMNFAEAEKTADSILKTMGLSAPAASKGGESKPQQAQPSSPPSNDPTKRLREKVARVEPAVHRLMDSGRDATEFRKAIEEEFKPLMAAGKLSEAEAVVDRVLAGLTKAGVSTEPPTVPDPAVQQRVAAKVERVTQGVKKWMASGRDPSAILKAMEKTGHLIQEGKVVEAEPQLDRALEQLNKNPKSTEPPVASAEAVHQRVAAKVERVTQAVQKWPASGRDPSAILKTMGEKVGPLLDAGKFVEAEAELDRVLEQLTKGTSVRPAAQDIPQAARAKTEELPLSERLPPKIQKIQKELPTWIEMPGNKEQAAAFMQKLKEHLDAMNFEEAEKTADSILKMMGLSAPAAAQSGQNKPPQTQPSSPPSNDPTKRLTEKVERVEAIAQNWAASGRDASTIAKAMQEKFKPLLEAGKVVEAEAELDRILEQLGDKKAEGAAADAPTIPQDTASDEERLPPKIHRIQKELPVWSEKPGNKEKAAAFMQKLKEHLDAMNFAEAEKTADAILAAMGVSTPAAGQSGENKPQPPPPSSPPSNDPTKRLTEKVERVKAGAQKWAASGRDPSAIAKAMEEKFKPLMEAGKVAEAEAELDRVLEQLKQGPK